MQIHALKLGHPLWEKVISFASESSWSAGPSLAKMMRNNSFTDCERVFAALEGEKIAGFALFSEKDGMPKELDHYTPFVGYLFVDKAFRGQRISEKIIAQVKDYAKEIGYPALYLKTDHRGLYEKYGFVQVCEFTPIPGTTSDQLFKIDL